MTELVLAGVIVALLVFLFVQARLHAQERRVLVNRVVARHTGEAVQLDKAGEKPHDPRPPRPTMIGT